MTKEKFYDFAIMMKRDSSILFNNNSLHNSVYLGAFVLESYIKILLIDKNQNYFGHLNDNRMLERLRAISPESFSNTILDLNDLRYPTKLLSAEYNINYRYEIDKWTKQIFCQKVQREIEFIKDDLQRLRIDGVIQC